MTLVAFEAAVFDDRTSFGRRPLVRLAVFDEAHHAYLMPDGTWQSVDEATAVPADNGLLLPAGAIEAIATAIQQWQGHVSHADTEARVLREWIAADRSLIDRLVSR